MQKPIVQQIVDFMVRLYNATPKDCSYKKEVALYCNADTFAGASVEYYKTLNTLLETMAKDSQLIEFHAEIKEIISQVYRILAFEALRIEEPLHENRYSYTEKLIRKYISLYYLKTKIGLLLIWSWSVAAIILFLRICFNVFMRESVSQASISWLKLLWWAALLGWLLLLALIKGMENNSEGSEMLVQVSSEYLFWGDITMRKYLKIRFEDITKVVKGRGGIVCIRHKGGAFLIKEDSFSVGNYADFLELITRYRPRPIPIVIKELSK